MMTSKEGIINLGRTQYLQAIGYYDLEKDDDGFVVLKPTASRVDKRVASLTTDINTLEEQLRKFKAQKAEAKAYQKTDEYKESKKAESKKKKKKAKENILNMVFNNADAVNASEDEDEEGYKDNKKKGPKKPKDTTRDTTIGKRYEPIISMLYDSVSDFEKIADEINEELKTNKTRNMYRSTQIGNLLSAKDKKMAAVKELRSIADKITDYEYKEKTANAKNEESDSSKAVSMAAARFLRGAMMDDSKGKKGKKKDREESSFKRQGKKQGVFYDPDDDDDDEDDWEEKAKRKKNKADADDDESLAKALASEINKRGGVSFTSSEKYSYMEGRWKPAIIVDPSAPEKTARFVALDPKTDRVIKNFKEDFPGLLPRLKDTKLRFDISKKRAVDSNSGKKYMLLFKD